MSRCINRVSAGRRLITPSVSSHRGPGAEQLPNLLEGTLANDLAFARDGGLPIADFGMDALDGMTRDGRCCIRLV
jgi:hypothetical protein